MERIDPFFSDQPPLEFIEELKKPFYQKKPENFGKRRVREGEYDCSGVYLDFNFPDENGYLETAIFDFERFAKLYEIAGNRYPVRIIKGETPCFEAFYIDATDTEITVTANDTEGVRRAIIFIEDEFCRREGAFFPKERVFRKPVIHTRLTRGFFSPTNRPPKMGDELFDDIDYYPDEYLNRLAHDGSNGIWIYTSFKALMTSRYFPEYGEGGEKRIQKLREVTKKCLRYGIKTYVFAMEPMNLNQELAAAHPDVVGYNYAGEVNTVCLSTEIGRAYILEQTEKLCRLVPELGGYMGITAGERFTHCASSTDALFKKCPRCSKRRHGEMLAEAVNLIREGMRRAGTGAQYISWTYGHRLWTHDEICDYVRNADDDIMLMQNFEEIAYPKQLGKERIAVDYWLSYPGPSTMFEVTAREAIEKKKHIFAKMQICCSHELATVPYIPAPGIVFDKYKGAYGLSVEGVLQCWYFGNYPSIMSKAAGELSFCSDFSDKDGFLRYLAATYFGESRADEVVKAWRLFEEGYTNYPINIMFSYFGPMHDGVVWQLWLKPKDRTLPRSWQLLDTPDGDRIHECMWTGHTHDEMIILSERMRTNWHEGMKHLSSVCEEEIYPLAKSIDILLDSGTNILKFYKLRESLGHRDGDPLAILSEMRSLVLAEIENSEKMIPVCEADCRLGYHSEAEGFKFFPKKLKYRIQQLKTLLETEFVEVEERIKQGKAPLEFYEARENGKLVDGYYPLKKCDIESAAREPIGDSGCTVAVSYSDDEIYLRLEGAPTTTYMFAFEYQLERPASEVILCKGNTSVDFQTTQHQSLFGEKQKKYLALHKIERTVTDGVETTVVTVPRAEMGWTEEKPMRVRVQAGDEVWIKYRSPIVHLGKNHSDPACFKWLIPDNYIKSDKD